MDGPIDDYNNIEWTNHPTIKPETISRRDYFAAMAMQGLITSTSGIEALASIHPASHAGMAVECADALLYELDKKDKSE